MRKNTQQKDFITLKQINNRILIHFLIEKFV